MNQNNYYVYVYLDPMKKGKYVYNDLNFNYEPFYIGKGKGKRIVYGLDDINNSSSKKSRIKHIRRNGFEPIILKIYENLTETMSYYLEKNIINEIGRDKNNGILVNRIKGSSSKIINKVFIDKNNKMVIVINVNSIFYELQDGRIFNKKTFHQMFDKI